MERFLAVRLCALFFVSELVFSVILLKVIRRFLSLELFESILLSCVLAMLTTFLLLWFYSLRSHFSSLMLSNLIWVLVTTMLLMIFVLPNTVVNIDRSRSFYVLSWVKNGDVFSNKAGGLVVQAKSPEGINAEGIQQRLEEQISRGLVKRQGESYYLTKKGNLTLWIANIIANFYDLDGWYKNRN